jgi:phytoene desaturase
VKNVLVIGSGFAGLSAACHLAKTGARVTVLDKNPTPGGRGHTFSADGFTYDAVRRGTGCLMYFERFFAFGKKVSDYYTLTRLDPSYRVFWGGRLRRYTRLSGCVASLFEKLELCWCPVGCFSKRSCLQILRGYWETRLSAVISPLEFVRTDVLSALFRIQFAAKHPQTCSSFFSRTRSFCSLLSSLYFFSVRCPKHTALYTLMNHADMVGGTWYP